MKDLLPLLEGVVTPSDYENIMRAETLFDRLEYTEHQKFFTDIFSQEGQIGYTQMGEMIYGLYEQTVDDILISMGVTVADRDDCRLLYLNDILELMLQIEDPDNMDVISAALVDDEDDPINNLSAMLSELGPQNIEYYAMRFESVDPALFSRIKMQSGSMDLTADASMESRAIAQAVKKFQGNYPMGPVYRHLLKQTSFPVMFSTAISELGGDIANQAYGEQMAHSLYMLTIAANLPREERVDYALRAREDIASGAAGVSTDNAIQRFHQEALRGEG